MVKITKATFGDEFDSTDVSSSLASKVNDGGIDVAVDSSIIPVIDKASGAATVKLSGDEQREIKETASQMCGPSDQVCLQVKTQELAQAKLKEKEVAKSSSTATVIKGRKLTVTYIDDSGKERTAIIPEGQRFQLGAIGKKADSKPLIDTEAALAPAKQVADQIWGIIGKSLLAFLYISSVIITWMTYRKYGSKLMAAGVTAIAVFVPLSGFGLSFLGPAAAEFLRVNQLLKAKADPSLLPDPSTLAKGILPSTPRLEDPTPLAASMRGGRFLLGRK